MSDKFKVTVGLEEVGTFPTFTEAFSKFFTDVKEIVKKGCSYQVLETACWIELTTNNSVAPLYFYDAKVLAYELGILVDKGDLADPMPELTELDEEVIATVFATSLLEDAIKYAEIRQS